MLYAVGFYLIGHPKVNGVDYSRDLTSEVSKVTCQLL